MQSQAVWTDCYLLLALTLSVGHLKGGTRLRGREEGGHWGIGVGKMQEEMHRLKGNCYRGTQDVKLCLLGCLFDFIWATIHKKNKTGGPCGVYKEARASNCIDTLYSSLHYIQQ